MFMYGKSAREIPSRVLRERRERKTDPFTVARGKGEI